MTFRVATALAGIAMFGLSGLLGGCGPTSGTLRALSSGAMECGAGDIGVYGRTRSQSDKGKEDTWTATCKGKLYTCYRIVSTEEVTCSPQGSAEGEQASTSRPQGKPAFGPAPTGAAGFGFGASLEDEQKLCEDAKLEWFPSGKEHTCSGAPDPLGFDAVVNLHTCSGKVCGISLVHRPADNWVGFIGDLKDRLVAKYGQPTDSDDLVPRLCRSPEDFAGCVDRGDLHLRFTWAWPSGERVSLVVGQVKNERGSVRVDYVRLRSSL